MKPNKKRLALWRDKLMTTSYPQGEYDLCLYGRMCCLGIATMVYTKETGGLEKYWKGNKKNRKFTGCNELTSGDEVLPAEVANFFGIDNNPNLKERGSGHIEPASSWNDVNNKTFKQIADMITYTFKLEKFKK